MNWAISQTRCEVSTQSTPSNYPFPLANKEWRIVVPRESENSAQKCITEGGGCVAEVTGGFRKSVSLSKML